MASSYYDSGKFRILPSPFPFPTVRRSQRFQENDAERFGAEKMSGEDLSWQEGKYSTDGPPFQLAYDVRPISHLDEG